MVLIIFDQYSMKTVLGSSRSDEQLIGHASHGPATSLDVDKNLGDTECQIAEDPLRSSSHSRPGLDAGIPAASVLLHAGTVLTSQSSDA
jgi:hypothetical protein